MESGEGALSQLAFPLGQGGGNNDDVEAIATKTDKKS
jgi:hypothetical protein